MRQHHIFDRLVGDGAHPLDHLVGHRRRRLRVEHDAAVVADDDSRIGIALGGEGIEIGADLGEGDFLLRHVGRRCETFCHQFKSLCDSIAVAAAVVAGSRPASAASPARSPHPARRDRRCDWRGSAPAPHRDRRSASSLKPRCASTTARNASSGLAKFELVDSAMIETSIDAARARQRGVERRSCRMPETRGDIAVGPQQIGRAGLGIVARADQPRGIGKAIIAADPDHADAIGRIDRGAIGRTPAA